MEKLNDKNFDEFVSENENLVVLDFYALWCNPCRMLAPVIEKLSEELIDVTFYKINVDESNDLAKRFNVTSIPTLVFMKNNKILFTHTGFIDEENLLEIIAENK